MTDDVGQIAFATWVEASEAYEKAIAQAGTLPNKVAASVIERAIRQVLAKPVDPLVEAVNEAWGWRNPHSDVTENLREALTKRGLEIKPIAKEVT